jgi:hypothetical protein
MTKETISAGVTLYGKTDISIEIWHERRGIPRAHQCFPHEGGARKQAAPDYEKV